MTDAGSNRGDGSGEAVNWQSIIDRLSEVENENKSIKDDVEKYTLEIVSRRSYERVVGIIVTVVAGLAIFLGVIFSFLGFDKLEKMDEKVITFDDNAKEITNSLTGDIAAIKGALGDTIDDKIALFFDRNESKAKVYRTNLLEIENLIKNLRSASDKWSELKPIIEGLGKYDPDSDLKGEFLTLLRNEEDMSREKKISIVTRVGESLKEAKGNKEFNSQFTADDIFNLAQRARALSRSDLEKDLVNAAYELDPYSPPIRALYLQWQAQFGPREERERNFLELLGLLNELTFDAPHIIMAEAWNASEGKRRYTDLIEALDTLIAAADADKSRLLPSFAFALKGNALQRRGRPGDLPVAMDNYIMAIDRMALEGTKTQWANSTIRDTVEGTMDLYRAGVDISPIRDAVKRGGVVPLEEKMRVFEHLTSLDEGGSRL